VTADTRSFERKLERSFPVFVAHLLSRFNGFAVCADEAGGLQVQNVPARELPEPAWWPAQVYGDHFMLLDTDIAEGLDFFVLGELADSGYLCLGIAVEQPERDTQSAGPPVFWLDKAFSREKPYKLADNTAAFIVEWSKVALSLPLLLKRCHVPGWG
jgi:hypothetical protein